MNQHQYGQMTDLSHSDQFNKTLPDLPWNYNRYTEQEEEEQEGEEVLSVSKIKEM